MYFNNCDRKSVKVKIVSISFFKALLEILSRPNISKYCLVYACQISK